MTEAERRVALEQIADEVRACTRCRLHEQRTHAVPGEGNPDTEVIFVGEGPGFNEDREGRPFVGRAGALLVKLLASVGWRREDVFITNVVKCRPPDNRDPQPDEIAACAPYLRRQLEVLDPALVVTLGRYSMGTFMPGARISQAHGTMVPAPPETGAARRAGVRDVPPGRRPARDGGRAGQLCRHGDGSGCPAEGARAAARRNGRRWPGRCAPSISRSTGSGRWPPRRPIQVPQMDPDASVSDPGSRSDRQAFEPRADRGPASGVEFPAS